MNQELLNDSSELKMTIRFKSKKIWKPGIQIYLFCDDKWKKILCKSRLEASRKH